MAFPAKGREKSQTPGANLLSQPRLLVLSMCAKAQRSSCLKSGKSGGSQWHSVHNRVLVWCGFGTCQGDERAGPPPPAAWPGAVPTSWCHHRLAKGTQPSAGCRLLQNWLLHQPLEPKALTNTGSLKIGFFSHVVGALSLPVQWGLQEGLKKNTKRGEKSSIKNSIGV